MTAAGLGPPDHEGVEYVALEAPRAPRPSDRLRGVLSRVMRLLRANERAYWLDPVHRRWRDSLGHIEADAIVVNDAIALPLAFSIAGEARVVFDAHEYAPSEFETSRAWRLLVRPHVRWICRRYLPQVAQMTSVSRGIADRYERDFAVSSVVVTNAARFEELSPSEVGETIRLVHFGWPDPQRRLEETLAAVALLGENYSLDLLLAGSGPPGYLDSLRQRAAGDPRIRFLDPVPMRELPRFANAYDIGVFLLPPQHTNQEFTLPNKFFEYIQARIAPAIGPSPEMERIVREWDCGIVADEFTPEALAEAIAGTSTERLAELKRNADRAARQLCAERNREVVLDVVRRALEPASAPAPGRRTAAT